jgi:hypothetical protein
MNNIWSVDGHLQDPGERYIYGRLLKMTEPLIDRYAIEYSVGDYSFGELHNPRRTWSSCSHAVACSMSFDPLNCVSMLTRRTNAFLQS